MTNGHPNREEDFDLYALGALEGDEKRAIESHVAGCASCAGKLAEAQGQMAMSGLSAPPDAPPSGVKEKLMRRVATTNHPRSASAVVASATPGIFDRWWGLVAPLAAGLALATALLWLHTMQLDRQLNDLRATIGQQESKLGEAQSEIDLMGSKDTVMVSLAEQKAQPPGTARVLYNSKKGMLVYNGTLPPAPAGKSYQLWMVPMSGTPISAGVFESRSGDMNRIVMKLPEGMAAKAFAVTLEPAGGMPQPTGPFVLLGPVS